MVEIVVAEPNVFIELLRTGRWNGYRYERLYVESCGVQFIFFYTVIDDKIILVIPYRTLEVCYKAVEEAVKQLKS